MKIEGTYTVGAPRPVVWQLLNDPEALARTIPGCEALVPAGSNRYKATIRAGVGAMKGTYSGTVAIQDANPPVSYTLEIEGKGSTGFVRGRGTISLSEQGADTQVTVDGDGQAGGPIAAVGQRLINSAAKMMLADFFRRLNEEAQKRGGERGR